ncbi:hypothetical protein [Mycobacterium marinum]|uniref:hypothetical protein n=1 Tax=Mycobacterium marinum TaxID=1781 RepID=UPI00235A1D14|nr:hypothetical protein [Mycobacterium marinum]MDC8971487.1 hypothetical protein [Mycobacterium marinum]
MSRTARISEVHHHLFPRLRLLRRQLHGLLGTQAGAVERIPNRLQRDGIRYIAIERQAQEPLNKDVCGLLQPALCLSACLRRGSTVGPAHVAAEHAWGPTSFTGALTSCSALRFAHLKVVQEVAAV